MLRELVPATSRKSELRELKLTSVELEELDFDEAEEVESDEKLCVLLLDSDCEEILRELLLDSDCEDWLLLLVVRWALLLEELLLDWLDCELELDVKLAAVELDEDELELKL